MNLALELLWATFAGIAILFGGWDGFEVLGEGAQ